MRTVLLTTAVISFLTLPIFGEDIVTVQSIRFKGLVNLSKHEIIRGVPKKIGKDRIIINKGVLEKRLDTFSLIEKYSLSIVNGIMIIELIEKIPEYFLVVETKKETIPFELDKKFNILSTHGFHGLKGPIVIIRGTDVVGGNISEPVKDFLKLQSQVKKDIPRLFNEIESIHFNGSSLTVIARNRRGRYILEPTIESFLKLNYVLGYCDKKINSSHTVKIIRDRAVIDN